MSWYRLIYILLTDDDEETRLTDDDGTLLLTDDSGTDPEISSTWTPQAEVT